MLAGKVEGNHREGKNFIPVVGDLFRDDG